LNSANRNRLARLALLALLILAIPTVLAACGSDDETTSGGSDTAAETTGEAGAGGGSSAIVEEAKEVTAENEKPPTSIGYDEVLDEKPAAAKTVVYIACNSSPSCALIGEGFEEAVNAVGWNLKTLTWDATQPATLPAAMQTALRYDPVAVYFGGTSSYQQYSRAVPEYTKAGVKILQLGLFEDAPDIPTIIRPSTQSSYNSELGGEDLGKAFIAATEGDGSALVVTVSGISVVPDVQRGVEKALDPCEGCDLSVLSGTVEDFVGQKLTPQIIAELRKNPDVEYVITLYSGFITGLRQQLSAAGLNDVKVLGYLWDAESITGIKAGSDLAWTSAPYKFIGWQGLDQILRADQEMNIPKEAGVPVNQLITPDNVDTITETSEYVPPFDYKSEFEGLWQVK
jgi:ribose transport system substrate-binding protein